MHAAPLSRSFLLQFTEDWNAINLVAAFCGQGRDLVDQRLRAIQGPTTLYSYVQQ